jgi:hypothetical protein
MSPCAGEPDERPVDVADEVSRFADVVQAWWASAHVPDHHEQADRRQGDREESHHTAPPDAPDPLEDVEPRAEHTSSCRICPLCRALDLVRAVRPEVLEQVATAAETVAVLLREAAGDRDRRTADEPPSPTEDAGAGSSTTGGDRDDDLPDPFFRGTRIVVTDADEPVSQDHDEGGRTAWA